MNEGLSEAERQRRVELYQLPYLAALKELVGTAKPKYITTIHSFTPLYEGKPREIQIGVLCNRHLEPAQQVFAG